MCFPNVIPVIEETSDLDYCTAALSKLKSISFGCLDIHSLVRKYDSIRAILERAKVDCLILNETFLDDSVNDSELHIPDLTELLSQANWEEVESQYTQELTFNLLKVATYAHQISNLYY